MESTPKTKVIRVGTDDRLVAPAHACGGHGDGCGSH